MSSPDRNCFLAAARTASFIASITRSRSMPCSWQSASIFCAIDELIFYLPVFYRTCTSYMTYFSMSAQLLAYVYLDVRLGYQIQRNTHLPAGSILKKHVVALDSQQTTAKIALAVNRLPRLHLRVATGEAFEVGAFIKAAFEPRRRYFQGVGRVDEIFHVQNRAQVSTHFRAILVGDTLRLINEYTNNRLVLGAGYLGVYQLKAMIDCDSFSYLLNPLSNRLVSHLSPSDGSRPKRKSGRETHRTRPRAFEQAANYTERATFKQTRLGGSQPRFYDLADEPSVSVFAC